MGSASAATPDDARKALDAACPGLKTYAADLRIDAPAKGAASLDAQRDRKWSEAYTITVRVNDKPSGKLIGQYRAQGQSCYFEVEAVKAAEVTVAKSACLAICRDKPYSPGGFGYFGVDGAEEVKR
ncbi:MAG: hypothetical protein B7Y28_21420 [Polaromonas sp. 16-63-31]|nr:MAG: hypothetical protein B7Y60_21630 [Polaromonas sp. 35-63-35]OYZ16151.1 MAG: hypothetical protein B7Y28_21420 [Polaromonas sp. 16-63-31]OZA52985.1 MAG: hypothetical protein B7X88_03545 [Polaromonas sp. 17-63-33]